MLKMFKRKKKKKYDVILDDGEVLHHIHLKAYDQENLKDELINLVEDIEKYQLVDVVME